ncbi:T9SS type A sorting domain-containing protein [candidate division TA06 bacterium]|uniref:T9SS type A sorting domain-containing protein n=1 Tax=candidate division TA06 bacterium TaxID=2250710 RepID=A0A523USW5_UNCT6|nr:MAG: T9SS type A sorting domain-containing protein [candidate division TA06 bacterium]
MKTLIIYAILLLFSTVSAQPFTILSLTEPIPEEDALFGWSVSAAGDVNGDGFHDVLVGARLAEVDGLRSAGEAFLFLGPYLISVVPLTESVPESAAYFGRTVSAAGDVDGDGFDDVIVGAPGSDGRAVVFLGPDLESAIPLTEPVPERWANFGISVSGAGDVNGDGFDDVIVGSEESEVGGLHGAAEAFVFLGPALDSVISLTEPVPEEFARFGATVSGAGDVNGDGFDDVIVGARGANPWGITDAGEAFLFLGPDLDSVIPLTEPVPEQSAFFAGSVSGAGDVNGDGVDDVIVGARYADPWGISAAGEVFLFLGPDLDSVIPLSEPVPEELALFGWSVSGAGDVNGDGFNDVLVGAAGTVDGLAMAGEAFLFLGPDLDSVISFSEPAPDSDAGFSYSLSGAGDVDGDSLSDLVVGAPLGDVHGMETAGEAFVFFTRTASIEKDGGVLSLDAPPDTVFVDSSYGVMATVLNLGNVVLTFNVVATIDGHGDTVQVSGLAPDSSIQVTFENWQVPSTDSVSYTMTVCTRVLDDVDSTNDCGEKSIFAYNPVGVEEQSSEFNVRGLRFELLQNEPNPFGQRTVIGYSLPAAGAVTLEVYDITGRLVKTLVDEHQKLGSYRIEWKAKTASSGIYFYRLQAGGFRDTKKMTLLKK